MKAVLVVAWVWAASSAFAAAAAPVSPGCDGKGVSAPLASCTPSAPCEKAMDFSESLFVHTVTTPSDAPVCATPESGKKHPHFDDGPPLQLPGADGLPRYACVHAPNPHGKLPLVIFVHGAGGDATNVYAATLLRAKSDAFDLSGDPARAGFVIASVQGRNLHWPSTNAPGRHWDHYFRQLEKNADVAYFDALIDKLVAGGGADPQRIYLMGWSNGGRFSQFYGLLRHAAPTPGGNRVAAVASYAGASPYANPRSDVLGCEMDPPKSDLPVYLINRSCDGAMACDAKQAGDFKLPPGSDMSAWSSTLRATDPNIELHLIDGKAKPVTACNPRCFRVAGLLNHLHWPDGVLDGSAIDHEAEMLGFLRDHPLAAH